jgi:hypothetical protein
MPKTRLSVCEHGNAGLLAGFDQVDDTGGN